MIAQRTRVRQVGRLSGASAGTVASHPLGTVIRTRHGSLPSNTGTARCGSSGRATSPPPSRSSHAPRAPSNWRPGNVSRGLSCGVAMDSGWIGAPPIAGSAPSASAPGSVTFIRTCCAPRSSWPPLTPASRSGKSNSPPVMPTPDHHDLRPQTSEPRPSRRLRRRRLRHQRIARGADYPAFRGSSLRIPSRI
jgi:hypothetical protein